VFASRWLASPRPGRPSTLTRDESYLRSCVLPAFEGSRLADITRGEVTAWVAELQTAPRGKRGTPLAPASVQKAVQVLAKVLDTAVMEERIAVNPARGVPLPRVDDEEARFLTPDELLALEDAMPEPYAVLVPFLADVGLRIGEAAGLRWRDVDTWRGVVQVREVLVEVSGRVTFGPPKTRAGRRTVPTLTREVAERLEPFRGDPDGFVFGRDGAPLRPTNYRNRVWRPAVARAGLCAPEPTPHALRHTAVAHWIAAGVEPYKLAKWAGHRSVATIYRVYGHLLDTDASEEREALSAMRAAAVERRGPRGAVIRLGGVG
jgi:integrase